MTEGLRGDSPNASAFPRGSEGETRETPMLGSTLSVSQLRRQRRERAQLETTTILRFLLRAIDVLTEIVFIFGVLLMYARISTDNSGLGLLPYLDVGLGLGLGLDLEAAKSCPWRCVFMPFWCICGMWFARSCIQIYMLRLWEYSVEELWHDKEVLGDLRYNGYSISLALAAEVSIVLVSCKLDGEISVSAFTAVCPLIACACTAWIVQVVIYANEMDNRRGSLSRRTEQRFQMVVTLLFLLSLILGSLRVDGTAAISWLFILSPLVLVTCVWLVSCVGVTIICATWLWMSLRGNTMELDSVLADAINVPSISYAARVKVLSFISCCVLAFDASFLCLFLAEFFLVRSLEEGGRSLNVFFQLLLAASITLLVLKLILELIILPNLHGLENNLRSVAFVNPQYSLPATSVRLDQNNAPITIKGCVTCREPVNRIVSKKTPNIYIVDPDPAEGSDDLKRKVDCSVCFSRPSGAIFLPCGHSGVCEDCAYKWAYGFSREQVLDSVSKARQRRRRDSQNQLAECLEDISVVHTPLYLVRQSKTFFKTMAYNPFHQKEADD